MKRIVFFLIVFLAALVAMAQSKPGVVKTGSSTAKKSAAVENDPALPAAANAAMKAVDGEHMRQHVRFLSHDLLEGRGTGQRGGDIAAEYIATQFVLYGLKPAGDNGSFLQMVPLVGVTTLPESSFVLAPDGSAPMKLQYKDDYVAYNETLTDKVEFDAPIVWVGYGIEAPEYKWNDYKDVDVRGKVLLIPFFGSWALQTQRKSRSPAATRSPWTESRWPSETNTPRLQ